MGTVIEVIIDVVLDLFEAIVTRKNTKKPKNAESKKPV